MRRAAAKARGGDGGGTATGDEKGDERLGRDHCEVVRDVVRFGQISLCFCFCGLWKPKQHDKQHDKTKISRANKTQHTIFHADTESQQTQFHAKSLLSKDFKVGIGSSFAKIGTMSRLAESKKEK